MPLCLSQNILPFERFYTHTQRESVGQSHQHRVVPSLSLTFTTTTRNRNTRQTDRKTNGLTDQVCPKTHQPLRFIDYYHLYSTLSVHPVSFCPRPPQSPNFSIYSVIRFTGVREFAAAVDALTHSLSAVVFCICNYPNLHSYQHQTLSFFFFFSLCASLCQLCPTVLFSSSAQSSSPSPSKQQQPKKERMTVLWRGVIEND